MQGDTVMKEYTPKEDTNQMTGVYVARLSWLVKAQEISETLATPHRLFDVESVRKAAKQDDPLVAMQLGFVECCNTGCRSPLERFICRVVDEEGKATDILFMVDLIEGLTMLNPTMAVTA